MRRKNVPFSMVIDVKNFDLKNTIIRQPEIVDNFCRDTFTDVDGTEVVSVVDPVHVLLNQERLNNIVGNSAMQNFIDSFRNQAVDPFAELRAKCSTEDLLSMIKSRHLQSPCEVLAWAKYVKSNIDTFNSEVQKLVEAQQAQQSPTNEPPKNE